MYSKLRLSAALSLVLALAIAGVAFAVGTDNVPFVDGKVTPKKLDKKKFKPVALLSGVRNENDVTGTQVNPSAEYISYGKNIEFHLNRPERCPVTLTNGTPTEAAKELCPPDSFLGGGEAEVQGPGNQVIARPVVSVFAGPGKNELQLHTYSPDLGTASPVVPAKIVKSTAGPKYGWALDVPHSPETAALLITKFNATIDKSTKAVTARCKAKKFHFLRTVTYKDGTSEDVHIAQPCKRKK